MEKTTFFSLRLQNDSKGNKICSHLINELALIAWWP